MLEELRSQGVESDRALVWRGLGRHVQIRTFHAVLWKPLEDGDRQLRAEVHVFDAEAEIFGDVPEGPFGSGQQVLRQLVIACCGLCPDPCPCLADEDKKNGRLEQRRHHLSLLYAESVAQGDGAGTAAVRLLDAAGGRGGLAHRLGGELLARRLAAGGLAGCLLGAGHFEEEEVGGRD